VDILFLIEILTLISSETIIFYTKGMLKPISIFNKEDFGYKHIIMPRVV